jgi:hypothetical protein
MIAEEFVAFVVLELSFANVQPPASTIAPSRATAPPMIQGLGRRAVPCADSSFIFDS